MLDRTPRAGKQIITFPTYGVETFIYAEQCAQ